MSAATYQRARGDYSGIPAREVVSIKSSDPALPQIEIPGRKLATSPDFHMKPWLPRLNDGFVLTDNYTNTINNRPPREQGCESLATSNNPRSYTSLSISSRAFVVQPCWDPLQLDVPTSAVVKIGTKIGTNRYTRRTRRGRIYIETSGAGEAEAVWRLVLRAARLAGL
jgi:hypothetical protein